ncbi:hypothetical protein IV203_002017 [Nitzschia inconspicua]|uniref:Uncharacterized protein n=1 Tax=Nitzschia inconspicua TaxID=303405 RepID=A0A9K3PU84_9STRA|nr:hypothetical protein IV203_002017 [Nitzschia inconspicua]
MGVKIRFSEDVKEFFVPRLDDDQIDDLFYQEDEIGEMRHTAFMIECGLEEDPPDGPDVPPIPWGHALLAQQQAGSQSDSSDDSKPFEDSSDLSRPPPSRRPPPPRSRSTDDIEELEAELTPKTPQRRRLVVAKSGSLHGMKTSPTSRKLPPPRCNSSDNIAATDLNLAFAKTNKASPRSAKKFMRCKSGTAHGLEAMAAAAMKNIEEREKQEASARGDKPPISPARKLTRAKSGTSHGMATAAAAARKALAEKESNDLPPRSPVRRLVATKSGTLHGMRNAAAAAAAEEKKDEMPKRIAPVRKLVVAKSGTLHGMRKAANNANSLRPPRPESPRNNTSIGNDRWDSPTSEKREVDRVIFKNGKKTTIYKDSIPSSPFNDSEIPPRPPVRRGCSTSTSSCGSSDILSEMASSDDDNASNISISTNGSEEFTSPIKPTNDRKVLTSDRKVKLKKTTTNDSSSTPRNVEKKSKTTSVKPLKARSGVTASPSSSPVVRKALKKFKAKSIGNLDVPPAFRNR